MSGSLFVNTRWASEPKIFMGTILGLEEIPNGDDLPVLEVKIENSFERYEVLMSQPHQELRLTNVPDTAAQLVLWTARERHAVSRSDTVILLDTPDTLLHLPFSELHDPEIAVDIELFIAKCPIPSLAQFVRRVLGRPSVGIRFMNGALRAAGYEEQGSLARHSLQMAERSFDTLRGFTDLDRWLAATAGLLHGVGLSCPNRSHRTGYLTAALGTLDVLSEDLRWLGGTHPDLAQALRFIIASMYRIDSRSQTHPTTKVSRTAPVIAAHLQSELMDSAAIYRSAFANTPPVRSIDNTLSASRHD